MKLEVQDTYEKDEELTTDFEPINIEDVINKAYLDEKILKRNSQLPILEKDYNEFKLQCNKQFVEVILIQRAVKMTIQNGLIDAFSNADKFIKDFFSPPDVDLIYQSK